MALPAIGRERRSRSGFAAKKRRIALWGSSNCCGEAHGREEQACVLARNPGMTVEAAPPYSGRNCTTSHTGMRSDTALDRLMPGAPAPRWLR